MTSDLHSLDSPPAGNDRQVDADDTTSIAPVVALTISIQEQAQLRDFVQTQHPTIGVTPINLPFTPLHTLNPDPPSALVLFAHRTIASCGPTPWRTPVNSPKSGSARAVQPALMNGILNGGNHSPYPGHGTNRLSGNSTSDANGQGSANTNGSVFNASNQGPVDGTGTTLARNIPSCHVQGSLRHPGLAGSMWVCTPSNISCYLQFLFPTSNVFMP